MGLRMTLQVAAGTRFQGWMVGLAALWRSAGERRLATEQV
jgi:hypothetical protein